MKLAILLILVSNVTMAAPAIDAEKPASDLNMINYVIKSNDEGMPTWNQKYMIFNSSKYKSPNIRLMLKARKTA